MTEINAKLPIGGASSPFLAEQKGFAGLVERYAPFRELIKKDRFGCLLYDRVFFVALDTEWRAEGNRNAILTYQMATVSESAAVNHIVYAKPGQRLRLVQIIEKAIADVHGGEIPADYRRGDPRTLVVLIAHNTVAEWSALLDRDRGYITSKLTAIRKCPVTTVEPIEVRSKPLGRVAVRIYDTMLLSPAGFRSLERLSSLLNGAEAQKIDIPQRYKEDMLLFLREDAEGFEKYALRDTEVTIKVFVTLQEALNRLAFGEPRKLFLTLASAAVKGFLEENGWFKRYRRQLQGESFKDAYRLIMRAYHGGRNEGFFVGDSRDFEMKHRAWGDVDYAGCYPTALSLVPLFDPGGRVRDCRAKLVIDAETEPALIHEGVAPGLIRVLKRRLCRSPESFRKKLYGMKNRRLARRIREICERPDNTLIDEWMNWSRSASGMSALIPGFARVRFRFPEGTQYPCLPVSHEEYGLIYPLVGETCVTAAEVVLAVETGAEIEGLWSVELPVVRDEQGAPLRLFQRHIAKVIQARLEYAINAKTGDAAAVIYERLLKEFANSFYGKFAQGINEKKATDDATGMSKKMPPSQITEPAVAALATGFARAALSAALLAIGRFNEGRAPREQIDIASCTTDGFLIGIPATDEFTVVGEYYQEVAWVGEETGEETGAMEFVKKPSLAHLLRRFGCGGLLSHFDHFLPLCQMRQARIDLVGKDDYLEVKHLADYLISVKTRGQLGFLNTGACSIIARFGHRVPLSEIYEDPEEYKQIMNAAGSIRDTVDAVWLLGKIEEGARGGGIEEYPHITLETFKTILESRGEKDLTRRVSNRRVNTDFDWKRDIVWVDRDRTRVSPYTRPHRTLDAMVRKRRQMEKIRRRDENAPPEKVLRGFAVKEQTIRYRNGVEAALVREFLRAVLQGVVPATLPGTYRQCAEVVTGVWKELGLDSGKKKSWAYADFNNAKRPRAVEPGTFSPEPGLLELVGRLSEEFSVERDEIRRLLFSVDLFLYQVAPIARDVVTAILNGPRLDISPFPELSEEGLLPARSRLVEVFGHLVPDIDRIPFEAFPEKRSTESRSMVQQLFRRAGLDAKSARLSATAIVPVVKREWKPRVNPSQKRCLEVFVQALHQPDLVEIPLETSKILSRLRRFGLSPSIYYRVRKEKFAGKILRRSSENRNQIERMAKALKLDPERLQRAMLK